MRKIYVELHVRLIVVMNEELAVGDVLDKLDWDVTSTDDGADVQDAQITHYEILDSK
jgi:hypothetical protein